MIKSHLDFLQQQQEEAIIFDGCFNMLDSQRASWIEGSQSELLGNLDYLEGARGHIARLRDEILKDKMNANTNADFETNKNNDGTFAANPIAT